MTPKEFADLLEEIKKNYEIYNYYKDGRRTVKYVDCHYDSRDGLIWSITLRDITNSKEKEKNFQEKNCNKEKIIGWLNETTKI